MRDNLIFTGICKTLLLSDEEDVERTLLHFLETEIGIYRIIDFHRVHRLGAYNRDTQDTNPWPIIAKFEKFKDREFVRSHAQDTLRGKRFGIRKQFPREIEEKRKLFYPLAKEARQNKDKVRMVRDKLFINNREVKIDSVENYERQRTANTRKHQKMPGVTQNLTEQHIVGSAFSIAVEVGQHAHNHAPTIQRKLKNSQFHFQIPSEHLLSITKRQKDTVTKLQRLQKTTQHHRHWMTQTF